MSADQIKRPRPVLFYDRHGVVVTNRLFSTGWNDYEIESLTHITQVRGRFHPGVLIAGVIVLAEALLVVVLAGTLHTALAWALTVLALLIPCVVGVVLAVRWPPRLELQAEYRGLRVFLFASRDSVEFGKLTRALHRAVESANHGG